MAEHNHCKNIKKVAAKLNHINLDQLKTLNYIESKKKKQTKTDCVNSIPQSVTHSAPHVASVPSVTAMTQLSLLTLCGDEIT